MQIQTACDIITLMRTWQAPKWFWLGFSGWLFSVVACVPMMQSTTATPRSSLAITSVPTFVAQTTVATSAVTRVPISTTAITLTLWTVPDLAPGTTPAGRIMQNQLDAFRAANPNIHVNPVLKKPYDKGGVLDFLQTTSAVVPAQLPDLVVLDLAQVPLAAQAGLLQPLESILPVELANELFPFAQRAARYRDQWVAVPYVADVEHLVYNTSVVKKPPLTWDHFLTQKEPMLLPLGGDDAFLAQYAALAPLNETPSFDWASTTLTFTFFKRARDAGLLSDATIGLRTVDETWALFVARQAPMAQVSATRYLSERDQYPGIRFAPLPTRDGKIISVATGWAFAITTKEPARQLAAARLIQWLVGTEQLVAWARVAHRLPATRIALLLTIEPFDYAAFLREQMDNAVYLPRTPAYVKAAEAWRTALANLWKGQTTPEEAARTVAAPK
jgi:ABC-type glycerol-3-phosphate transport system substrate-binding protein